MILLMLCTLLAESGVAYLFLDLTFRRIPVDPESLRVHLRRYGWRYTALAALFTLGGGALEWRMAGTPGAWAAGLNWLPWWVLWHFGLRKQFTFLYIEREPGH